MSSIYRFQVSGFKISVFKISAKATAIFVPMAAPWVCGQSFLHRAGMNFLLSFELSLNQILRSISPIISQYGWRENDNVQSIHFAKNFST